MTDADSVLVIDDEQEIVAVVREHLEAKGYRVASASSCREGLAALREGRVAVVLLDLMLPDGNGIDVMHAALRLNPPPAVIIVTGHATVESAVAAVDAGAAGYLLKPVDLAMVESHVAAVLERRRLIGENAALQAQLAERLRETEALFAVSQVVTSTIDLTEALRRISRELTKLTGADTAAAYLHDPGPGLLRPCAAYRVPREYLESLSNTTLPSREQGFYLPLWQDRRPVDSDDVAHDPRFGHAAFRAFPHQSGTLLPLILDGEVAGAFYLVWWKARRTFDERELTLLEHVGQQVGLLLRNARLFETGERDRRRLSTLYEVSRRLAAEHDTEKILSMIVHEAAELLGVEAAGLRLRDGNDLVVGARTESAAPLMSRPRLRLGESLSGIVVETGAPVLVEDLAKDERYDAQHKQNALTLGYYAFAGVPLRAGGGVIGTLNVYSRRGRRFLPDELSLLSAFADQASLAIEKSRLLQATQAREREATKLYTITAQLASGLGLGRKLDLVTADVIELLGCDAAGIYGYDAGRGGLTFRRGVNLDPELTRNLILRPGDGVAGRAFAERGPVWTRDRLADPLHYTSEAARLIADKAPRASLAVPIIRRDEVYGVLTGYYSAPHDFTPDEIRLLTTLATQAAIAVDNSLLFEETRTQQIRLSQIFESTSDGIMLIDDDSRVAAANPRATELLGTAVEAGRALADILGTMPATVAEAWHGLLTELPPAGRDGDVEIPGPSPRVLHWVARPTLDAAGGRVGVTLTLQDVTHEREVSQMKSDFVSFVTHQLRTPLAGIKWLLELASEDPALPEESRGYVADSREAAERLIKLVNELLDISRLESGRLTITPVPVDLGALTREVLTELETLVNTKGHAVTLTGAATVVADRQLLRQVVLNLASNAVKYTPPGGTITVTIRPDAHTVTWSIADTGIGIPAGARPRLFEKFYRADNVQTLETEGTGLGLYLVRLIVEQFKGDVRYDSTEGAGSTFAVTLPAAGSAP